MEQYRVKLVGWPFNVLVNPSKLSTQHVNRLDELVQSKKCYFVSIGKEELKEFRKEKENMKAAGIPPLYFHNSRPLRSKRKCKEQDASSDEEEGNQSRTTKKVKIFEVERVEGPFPLYSNCIKTP